MDRMTITDSVDAYEQWLKTELRGELVAKDFEDKHDKMRKGAFPFLRATYWRWAETIFDVCPELKDAPAVLAVGDIHLENFGTWRDDEARLVWGVNDFDEAAEMPYALDLVRLATSAILARSEHEIDTRDICTAIWEGYGKGLREPTPFVLDEEHAWLRKLFIASEDEREEFWQKMDGLKPSRAAPGARYQAALAAALPERGIELVFRPRQAGTGSLGRPRWVGIGSWRGGRLVREAKALVISGWSLALGSRVKKLYAGDIVAGKHRALDPWYRLSGNIVVRRLSPNTRKIEVKKEATVLLDERILRKMGHELANVHTGTGDAQTRVRGHFSRRNAGWLRDAAKEAAKFVSGEYEAWKR
jgi:Uncharacterized protein conserved in bacteria (DUF2252)